VHELAILGAVVAVVLAATTVGAALIGPTLRLLEWLLLGAAVVVILFVMFFVAAEVVMRYLFNSPIPGHLEGSELLLPIIVFLALSYAQATHRHVGMDLVLDLLAPRVRDYALAVTLLLSVAICSVLGYFSFKNALQLWEYNDVTMTPPYFKTWPSAGAIPLGYALISIRMWLQVLHLLAPERFGAYEPHDVLAHPVD